MTTHSPPSISESWNVLPRSRLAWLIESAPNDGGQPTPAIQIPGYRLTRAGQITLGLSMSLLVLILYGQIFERNQQLSKRFQFCRSLQSIGLTERESFQQSQSLINNLAYATESQKLRLQEQVKIIHFESSRLCRLASFFRSKEAALMTVATAALCLLSLTIVVGLGNGLPNNSNRTLQTLQVTAMFSLMASMVFLQLGQQSRNTNNCLQLYLAHRNLHQQLLSALANQDQPFLSAFPNQTNGTPMRDLPQLTTSARVAQLIRNVDNELQSMPPVPLQLNDKAVTQVYAWLSNNWKGTASK